MLLQKIRDFLTLPYLKKIKAREIRTDQVTAKSRVVRREAEAYIINSYRHADMAVTRHDWRD